MAVTLKEWLAEQLAKAKQDPRWAQWEQEFVEGERAALAAKQKDLDPLARKVLDENLWELYE